MGKLNVKNVIKHLKDISVGDKFATRSGDTEGVLIDKNVGQCKILITKRKPSPEFLTADGDPDSYWFGFQNWSPDTEIRSIDE